MIPFKVVSYLYFIKRLSITILIKYLSYYFYSSIYKEVNLYKFYLNI
jgi:hypothetical protein